MKGATVRLVGTDLETYLSIVVDFGDGVSVLAIFAFFAGGGVSEELSESTLKPISTVLILRENYWRIVLNNI